MNTSCQLPAWSMHVCCFGNYFQIRPSQNIVWVCADENVSRSQKTRDHVYNFQKVKRQGIMFIIFGRYYRPKKYRLSGISVPVSAKKISAISVSVISAKTNIGRALATIAASLDIKCLQHCSCVQFLSGQSGSVISWLEVIQTDFPIISEHVQTGAEICDYNYSDEYE